MRFLTGVIAVVLTVGSALYAAPELSGTPQELTRYLSDLPKEISLSATAIHEVAVDQAKIELLVETEMPSLRRAIEANRDIRQRITRELAREGIAEDAIHASKFVSIPKDKLFGKSHVVENRLIITIENETQLESVAAQVDQEEAVTLQSLSFDLANDSDVRMAALDKALAQLSLKKQRLEKSMGVSLKPVGGFTEHVSEEGLPQPRHLARMVKASMPYEEESLPASAKSQFDTKRYHAHVSAQYRVQP